MQYSLYGGVLSSELSFPELADVPDGPSTWSLDVEVQDPYEPASLSRLGERIVGSESYILSTHSGGFRLEYSHAGVFDIHVDSGRISWHPSPGASEELARAIVIGPVFALMLEAQGFFCLHGSCVVTEAGAIAFVGPKHFGKSTLSLALTAAGCRFVSDDTVAIRPGHPATVLPAVPSLRLWAETLEAVPVNALDASVTSGIKSTVSLTRSPSMATAAAPLVAVYELLPLLDDVESAQIRRVPLERAAAVVALAHHRKLPDPLVGLEYAGRRLRDAALVAAAVPVLQLTVPRSFDRLQQVVSSLLSWHGPASPRS